MPIKSWAMTTSPHVGEVDARSAAGEGERRRMLVVE
jgi:hypothetical protein